MSQILTILAFALFTSAWFGAAVIYSHAWFGDGRRREVMIFIMAAIYFATLFIYVSW